MNSLTDWKWWLRAVIVVVLSAMALFQVVVMMDSELLVNTSDGADPAEKAKMLEGLMGYFQAFGWILIAAGVAYMFIGYEEDIVTDPPSKK